MSLLLQLNFPSSTHQISFPFAPGARRFQLRRLYHDILPLLLIIGRASARRRHRSHFRSTPASTAQIRLQVHDAAAAGGRRHPRQRR